MIQVYKFNDDFIFETPVIVNRVEENGEFILPNNCTKIAPSDGLYKPKFSLEQEEWFESATEKYIEDLQQVKEPSDLELLKEQNALLISQLAQAQAMAKDQAQMYADLLFSLTQKGVI
ncbi:hypothetical protein MOE20_06575 [Bacillus atrophaeus]|uniref:hypothetical protein n=1 Tax=Bacillus atrophaeus TaxID=1452 RepID=UPI00227E6210|nr:hypothetical protein [Bacillus atrophaeus]MCY8915663.1 hypothetical protein [Bacillus atrophaeus]MCY8924297.1 hypothetical protein [Bacillus atrophaeus]MCY9112090.1 hypothetical protein [Bacillus atrophaeus]